MCDIFLCSNLGKLEEEFEKKFNSLPQYSPLTFDKKSSAVTKRKKASLASPVENPTLIKGECVILDHFLLTHPLIACYGHANRKCSEHVKSSNTARHLPLFCFIYNQVHPHLRKRIYSTRLLASTSTKRKRLELWTKVTQREHASCACSFF